MSHMQPAFDGMHLEASAPAKSRRIVDDLEAWWDEIEPHFVDFADMGVEFTIEEVARKRNLPDPPRPKSQWGVVPIRLQNKGIIRHCGARGSIRAHHSLVHVWIGVPAPLRENYAERRRLEREARRNARAQERRAA